MMKGIQIFDIKENHLRNITFKYNCGINNDWYNQKLCNNILNSIYNFYKYSFDWIGKKITWKTDLF